MGSERELILNVLKVFGLGAFSFVAAMAWTPILTNFLYKHRLWRKSARTMAADGSGTPIFHSLHKEKEVSTPRLGGLLIWLTAVLVALLFWVIALITSSPILDKLNFLSRNQTWLPFFMFVAAAGLGLADDLFQIYERGSYRGGGMGLARRIAFITLIAAAGAYWFYFKLDWRTIYIPFLGDFYIDGWYIPLFILVTLATFSGGVIDGIDGLSGGVFASIFAAYGGIAFFQGQIDLATFCIVTAGAILAFLWFNIPPARFYMSETGTMGLTVALTTVAFLTDSVAVLPIIGFLLVIESLSVIIQFASKRWRGKKIFLVAPIHHHFEARGWPGHKVTMRFWVVSVVFAIMGMVIALIGR
ncbi:MAG: phospho-N-acetylmuramoyl-pentapeptide-transferase [Candidatus Sungbacteria bacterium]|uniref:Phospho-N-acetylmuramoyl-pentapeptide-transferase n=1 Tax=Candidatus Sungiibacteriota bacterium TaxID=2750080 RepID=A0A931WNH9_9BACT|nr:phospho-N-acetylmuramoyl-pentapeptide-transferase [Candidatus Sungbacteria bacterium]